MGEPPILQRLASALRPLHWKRGLRAGLAVAAAMIVCRLFGSAIGWAAGWAALGGFEAILVDNGGPYRTRFITIATLLAGGSLGCVVAAFAFGPSPITTVLLSVLVTAGFCFLATFARVIAQPVASTSVIILVIYFAAWGSGTHSLRHALGNALAFVLGGAWAAVLSLVLWPVDPFRPARREVSLCYESLADFTAEVSPTERGSLQRERERTRAFELQRRLRSQIESARAALAMTAARAPSRTVRARNLTVLLETVDMLFAVTIRMTELALGIEVGGIGPAGDMPASTEEENSLRQFTRWLSDAERSIALGLQSRPSGDFILCLPEGPAAAKSLSRRASNSSQPGIEAASLLAHLAAAELDAWQNIEIACEAVNAVWSGVEIRAGSDRSGNAKEGAPEEVGFAATRTTRYSWVEAIRANWTLDSVMMRHALRMTIVGAIDVLLLRVLHLRNGYWLAMTSIIVLQPYPSHTLKRSAERVGGTIAGGVLAAILAAAITSPWGIIAVVTATSVLTLATYAVDYAWYCFFLTPTFVLLSLPHLRDWEFSGVRMLTTLLGALVSVAAMRLLWPEREHLALGELLARAAGADAAYIRATLRYWEALRVNAATPDAAATEERRPAMRQVLNRQILEREIMAPARRAGGLASNDAEESVDRLLQDSGLGSLAGPKRGQDASAQITEHALTFVTYLRRLRQSATTLAVLAKADSATVGRMEGFAARLDAMSAALRNGGHSVGIQSLPGATGGAEQDILLSEDKDIGAHQLQRMQRQIAILERAAAGLVNGDSAA